MVPVDDARVEPESLVVRFVAVAPQREEVVDPVPRVGLGVRAVERHVPEGALGQSVPFLDAGGQLRLLAPDRQGSEDSFRRRHRRVGSLELALHPPAPGERPLRDADRLAALVVERIAPEVLLAQLDEAPVPQGIADPGGDVEHARATGLRAVRSHRQDGGHHHVDGDDVDDPLGHAGELAEQARGRTR